MLLLLLPRLGLRQLLRLTPSLAVDMEVAMGLLAAVATRIAGPGGGERTSQSGSRSDCHVAEKRG